MGLDKVTVAVRIARMRLCVAVRNDGDMGDARFEMLLAERGDKT